MELWMPGAYHEPVQNNSGPGSMRGNMGLVLHVQEGNGDLQGWFNTPNAQASAHFQVRKNGNINQFVATNAKAWAQSNGNSNWYSVETEGFTNEPLTDAQLNGLVAIYRFGGWPLQLSDSPGTPGFGWHGMGGSAWGGHYGCPGDIRKNQRQEVLNRIGGVGGGGFHPGPPASPEHRFDGYPVLRIGSTDANSNGKVSGLQRALNTLGNHLAEDGSYGPATAAIVRVFQAHRGLTVDGIFGAESWKWLGKALAK